MELWLIFKVLMRRWWLVLIPTIIVLAFSLPDLINREPASAGGFSTVIRYTAAQELDAIPDREGDFQDVWLASELTVNAFTEWVRTNRFRQSVAEITARDGLEINADALSIAADNERSIGQIFVNWPDEAELQVIATAVTEVLQTQSQAYFPQLGGEPAQVEVLDEPRINPTAAPLPSRLRPLVQIVLGIMAGVGLAFLFEYLDPTLRERSDLERQGLQVIASIPRK